ncbi:MAG: hypothetical protein H6Q66_504 [Firmicutes bacterium]|nr:hypothetical protein [Bacillota bacterium]
MGMVGTFFWGIVLLAALLALLVWVYIRRQGNEKIRFDIGQRSDCVLETLTETTAVMSCKVPFRNTGSQDGTVMDAFPRVLLPYEQYDAVEVSARMMLETAPRVDGYWEAVIIPKHTGGTVVVAIQFVARQGDIRTALAEMVDMPIDLVLHIVSRSLAYLTKQRIVITSEEIAKALESQSGAQSEVL